MLLNMSGHESLTCSASVGGVQVVHLFDSRVFFVFYFYWTVIVLTYQMEATRRTKCSRRAQSCRLTGQGYSRAVVVGVGGQA